MVPAKKAIVLMTACLLNASVAIGSDAMTSTLSHRRFTTHDGLPQMQAETVWQDSRGYIYIGTLSGFCRYDGRDMKTFLSGRRANIVDFQEVDGEVYALGFRRYWMLTKGIDPKTVEYAMAPKGSRLLNNFNAADLPAGYVLTEDIEEHDRQLCRMTAHGPEGADPRICPSSTLLDEMTPDRKLFIDSTGVYVPTPSGLYRLDNQGREERIAERDDIYALCRWQGRLLAFSGDSIYEMTTQRFHAWPTAHVPLSPDYGLIVRTTHSGELLIADAHSLYRLDNDTLQPIATGFNLIKDIFIDSWDCLWMATYQGVYCFFNRRFTNHVLNDANDIVRAIAPLPDGRMVMGTLNGKLLVDGTTVSDHPDDFFVPSTAIVGASPSAYLACRGDVAVVESGEEPRLRWLHLPYSRYQFVAEANGKVILGTRQMILSLDPATETTDTLTTDIPHPWCATTDGDGRLWVGSTFGLYSIDSLGQVQQHSFRDHNLIVTTMAADSHNGTVFFASGDSLFTISKGQIADVADSISHQLAGHEIRSLHVSPRGFLVVAVIDGLFVTRIADGARLTDLAFFDHRNGFTMIEPQQAQMAETADGTVWMACLEGMTSFRPGELLADSMTDTYIAPPTAWWQRWWVLTLGFMALLVLVAGLVLLAERHRHRRRMLRLQREKKQKELQISAIRLKAIPHFHANVLAGIEYFLMNNATAEATRYLKLYSDFTNLTLIDIDRPARTVAEEVDYVRLYLQLEQLRYGERLNYDITVSPDVNQQSLLPTMLLHTYCQNALKHGIGSRPEGGHINVDISCDAVGGSSSDIIVRVTDNGIGRTAAASLNTNSTRQGLRILMEQIELYNQTNRRPIYQTVTDLTDEQGRPAGTCFQLSVPTDYVFEK